jgi:hypothetical protein
MKTTKFTESQIIGILKESKPLALIFIQRISFYFFIYNLHQILTILIFCQWFGKLFQFTPLMIIPV